MEGNLNKKLYVFDENNLKRSNDDIEYEMDEDDYEWIKCINESNDCKIFEHTFEYLIDRIEKKAFISYNLSYQTNDKLYKPNKSMMKKNLKFERTELSTPDIKSNSPNSPTSCHCHPPDSDAVCNICLDGECSNVNAILFCDSCDVPVHQECYGVPYVPEGQWLCRVCLRLPNHTTSFASRLKCVLCPDGTRPAAFKNVSTAKTTIRRDIDYDELAVDNLWAHVVCALWIPEVSFGNTVFLEPVDNVDKIPAARWRLTCYICKQRGVGACIQCQKTNCYTAFHVTCAQQAGLYMALETSNFNNGMNIEDGNETFFKSSPVYHPPTHSLTNTPTIHPNGPLSPLAVKKIAYCDIHTPSNLTSEEWSKSWSIKKSPHFTLEPNDPYYKYLNSNKKANPHNTHSSVNLVERARKLMAARRSKIPVPPTIVMPALSEESLKTLLKSHWPPTSSFLSSFSVLNSSSTNSTPDALANEQLTKQAILKRVLSYWKIKRQARNGFSLIKRFQFNQSSSSATGVNSALVIKELVDWQKKEDSRIEKYSKKTYFSELYSNMTNISPVQNKSPPPFKSSILSVTKFRSSSKDFPHRKSNAKFFNLDDVSSSYHHLFRPWLKLRQDLEKSRLLTELIRKREKLKKEKIALSQNITDHKLRPLILFLRPILYYLESLDTHQIFHKPVDIKQVSDYLTLISEPMDFSTMRYKLLNNLYQSFEQFDRDFNLMIDNCKTYNPKDSIFYKSALKLKNQSAHVMTEAQKIAPVDLITTTSLSPCAMGGETQVMQPIIDLIKPTFYKHSKQHRKSSDVKPLPNYKERYKALQIDIIDLKRNIENAKTIQEKAKKIYQLKTLRAQLLCKHRMISSVKKHLTSFSADSLICPEPEREADIHIESPTPFGTSISDWSLSANLKSLIAAQQTLYSPIKTLNLPRYDNHEPNVKSPISPCTHSRKVENNVKQKKIVVSFPLDYINLSPQGINGLGDRAKGTRNHQDSSLAEKCFTNENDAETIGDLAEINESTPLYVVVKNKDSDCTDSENSLFPHSQFNSQLTADTLLFATSTFSPKVNRRSKILFNKPSSINKSTSHQKQTYIDNSINSISHNTDSLSFNIHQTDPSTLININIGNKNTNKFVNTNNSTAKRENDLNVDYKNLQSFDDIKININMNPANKKNGQTRESALDIDKYPVSNSGSYAPQNVSKSDKADIYNGFAQWNTQNYSNNISSSDTIPVFSDVSGIRESFQLYRSDNNVLCDDDISENFNGPNHNLNSNDEAKNDENILSKFPSSLSPSSPASSLSSCSDKTPLYFYASEQYKKGETF
ncbi:bromodomain-containing protein DDB_G0280777-like [Gordionus sp. m RMFG-2023]|uniref:bromodomain-containing protein DDB_G0280777-like n=1 Tax=Gordionus sp. m RMFG-2023 TaxID=3053472 RepID=UPI0031FDAD7E